MLAWVIIVLYFLFILLFKSVNFLFSFYLSVAILDSYYNMDVIIGGGGGYQVQNRYTNTSTLCECKWLRHVDIQVSIMHQCLFKLFVLTNLTKLTKTQTKDIIRKC